LFRLLLDFIKPHYNVLAGLSTIQLTAIAGLLYYLPYLVKPRKLFKPAYA
jgi:phosphatidylglycerol---prolipoprotein diacylglyceryl transferase